MLRHYIMGEGAAVLLLGTKLRRITEYCRMCPESQEPPMKTMKSIFWSWTIGRDFGDRESCSHSFWGLRVIWVALETSPISHISWHFRNALAWDGIPDAWFNSKIIVSARYPRESSHSAHMFPLRLPLSQHVVSWFSHFHDCFTQHSSDSAVCLRYSLQPEVFW